GHARRGRIASAWECLLALCAEGRGIGAVLCAPWRGVRVSATGRFVRQTHGSAIMAGLFHERPDAGLARTARLHPQGMEAPVKRLLIINADDFGLNRAATDAIVECHRAGTVTSTTLMANTPDCTR